MKEMSSYIVNSAISALLVIIITLVIIFLYLQWIMRFWKRKNVPYFEPTILFGNRSVTGKNPIQDDVFSIVQQAKEHDWKYFGLFLGVRPYFVPLDTELKKCILAKDFNHFMERGMYYNEKDDPLSAHLIAIGGEKWKTLRTKLSPTFTSKKLKDLFPTLFNSGLKLEKHLIEGYKNEPVEFKQTFARLAMDVILSYGLGLESNTFKEPDPMFLVCGQKYFFRDKFGRFIREFQIFFPNIARALHLKKIPEEVSKFFYEVVQKTVNYRMENNICRNDFLQLLIDMKASDDTKGETDMESVLTMDEITAQCAMFVIAGYETTSSTMTFALYELATHPEIQEKVRNEIFNVLKKYDGQICYDSISEFQFMQQVIDETLRKYSPTPYATRVCCKDYKIPGTDIILEKGTSVLIPIKNTHYDENIYDNPEIFNPDRFSLQNSQRRSQYNFIPFGEGPRVCLAKRFAIIEVIVALTTVLKNFEVTLDSRTKTPIKFDPKSFFASPEGGIWLNLRKLN